MSGRKKKSPDLCANTIQSSLHSVNSKSSISQSDQKIKPLEVKKYTLIFGCLKEAVTV